MAGFNWVYKINQWFGWCIYSLPANLLSFFNTAVACSVKRFNHGISSAQPLYASFYEICFPQKYMTQSGGFRPANLQLLFSSESRPEPEDCFSLYREMYPTLACPPVGGRIASFCPAPLQGMRFQNTVTGKKGEFTLF
jgi:hypothetical protein